MGKAFSFKIAQSSQREFTSTLRKYSQISKRKPKVICDTKAFYIARRATVETPSVDAGKIREFIGRDGGAIEVATVPTDSIRAELLRRGALTLPN